MNQIKAGALLSYVNILASNLLNLVLTPFILRSLGQAEYGLYALVGAFVASLGVLDLGIGNAIVRYVAKFRAESDSAAEGAFLRMALHIYGVIALVTLGGAAVLFVNLHAIFGSSLSPSELMRARPLFLLMALNLTLSLPFGAFAAAISGHERFVFLRLTALCQLLLRTAFIATLLLLGYKALALVVVDTVLNSAAGLVYVAYVCFRLRVSLQPRAWPPGFVREVAFYSGFVFINLIVDQLFWRIGQVILGAVVGTAAVAIFALAMQIANCYRQLPMAISGVFLPRITAMVVTGASGDELVDLFARTARIQLVGLGCVLGGFVLFGREFLALWAGPAYVPAWTTALLVMIPLTVPLVQTVGLHILQAKNMHGFRSILYFLIAITNAVFSIPLAERWGPVGAALGTSVSLALGHGVILNVYYHRRVRLNMWRFARLVTRGIVPAALAAILLSSLLARGAWHSWTSLFLRGAMFTLLYAASMWLHGLNQSEKQAAGAFGRAACAGRWLPGRRNRQRRRAEVGPA